MGVSRKVTMQVLQRGASALRNAGVVRAQFPIAAAQSSRAMSVVPELPEGRFYPEWVDQILNKENATGPRRLKHKKRIRQRQLQVKHNHQQRIKETQMSLQRKAEKLQEQKELSASFGMKLQGVGAHKQWTIDGPAYKDRKVSV